MDNGAKKGGTPSAWDIIKASPHLEDLWQLHFSEEGGPAHNAPEPFIANLSAPEDAANYLKLTASTDGSFDCLTQGQQSETLRSGALTIASRRLGLGNRLHIPKRKTYPAMPRQGMPPPLQTPRKTIASPPRCSP